MSRQSLLSRPRAVAFVAIAAGLVAYFYSADSIPRFRSGGRWCFSPRGCSRGFPPGLAPAAARHGPRALAAALMLAVVAVLAEIGDLEVLANFAKLGAATFFAFWFLNFFEELFLLVTVAVIVPWVDTYSVFRGPTGNIVEHHSKSSPTSRSSSRSPHEPDDPRLGIPDLLFFALFLAAAGGSARARVGRGWGWSPPSARPSRLAAWIDISGPACAPGAFRWASCCRTQT